MRFVGLHIGNTYVSASYKHCEDDVKQLKLLKAVDGLVDKWTIPSDMYKYKDPNTGAIVYSLDRPQEAHLIISEMKKPISYMTEEEKEHYKAFIQLIVQRLKERNPELQEDFELAIACPTKWSDEQKEEYKEFFNDALGDYGIAIYAIMNESDAAFFAKYNEGDYDKKVLVVDYGSSTIDFTLVSQGKKVDLDDMSSSNLGASAIEKAVLATYATDKNSNYAFTHQTVDPVLMRNDLEWMDMDKFILAEIRKNKEIMFTMRDLYLETFTVRPYHITGIPELRRCDCCFRYDLEEPLMEIPLVKDYVKKVKEILYQLKERIEQDFKVDKIILSGGGGQMPWVKNALREIFNIEEIELSRYPESNISDGLVKYCSLISTGLFAAY